MNDSEIPAFTSKVLGACKRASKEGMWEAPVKAGGLNNRCCPLIVLEGELYTMEALSSSEIAGFTRGYDSRRVDDADERFYALGQGFRKIAETVGFAHE